MRDVAVSGEPEFPEERGDQYERVPNTYVTIEEINGRKLVHTLTTTQEESQFENSGIWQPVYVRRF